MASTKPAATGGTNVTEELVHRTNDTHVLINNDFNQYIDVDFDSGMGFDVVSVGEVEPVNFNAEDSDHNYVRLQSPEEQHEDFVGDVSLNSAEKAGDSKARITASKLRFKRVRFRNDVTEEESGEGESGHRKRKRRGQKEENESVNADDAVARGKHTSFCKRFRKALRRILGRICRFLGYGALVTSSASGSMATYVSGRTAYHGTPQQDHEYVGPSYGMLLF